MLDKGFFLFCMVICFYTAIKALQHFTYSEETLTSFINQFQLGYIQDIVATFPNESCPLGYKPMLTSFNWPGSLNGCLCNSDNKLNYTLYSGTCLREYGSHCIEISKTDPLNQPYWDNVLLCYRRANKNYIDLLNENNIIPNNPNSIAKCNNATHRICGEIDNIGNLLCLEKAEHCPITNFLIIRNKTHSDIISTINDTSAVITPIISKSNEIYYIVVSHSTSTTNNNNSLIYSNFRVDLSQPCLNGNKGPSNELLFDLMINKFDLSCDRFKNGSEIVDSLYTKIDTIPYLNTYLKENYVYDRINPINKQLSLNLDKLNIHLYAKAYPGWSFQCMMYDTDTFNNFLDVAKILHKLSFYTILQAFSIICLLIGIGICAFYFMKHFETLFYILILVFIVFHLVNPIQVISNANWVINNLSEENGGYCGDTSLNILLYRICNSCQGLLYSNIALLCIAILSLVVFLILLNALIKPTVIEMKERLIQLREINH